MSSVRAGRRAGARTTGLRTPHVAALSMAILLFAGCSGAESPAPGTSTGSTTDGGTGTGTTVAQDDGASGTATGPGDAASGTGAPGDDAGTGTESASGSADVRDGSAAPTGAAGIGLPSGNELAAARSAVSALSDRQLAGQLVVAAYSGTDAAGAAALVQENHLGGVITLGDNVPESVGSRVPLLTSLTGSVQQAVAADGRDWPAFLAIDQEGGAITRVGAPLDHWPAAMALGASRDPELAREVAQASGEQLRALGYTVALAPVADVTIGPEDPTIGSRSPGSDPAVVAEIATAQVAGFSDAGILSVAKHFPGHGTILTDSHLGVAEQTADLSVLTDRDLVPFRTVIGAGAPAIMPGHIVVDAVDPDLPATVSPDVITGLLRDDLGFGGLVVTDALNMGAITQTGSTDHPAVQALQAGVDVLLMPPDPRGAVDAIVFALEDGTLDRAQLEESAARMVATLRHQHKVPAPDGAVIGSDHDLSVRAAAAGITQLSGPCGQRLVGDSITIRGGTEGDRERLNAAAAAAGLGTGSGDSVVLVGGSSYQAGGGPGGPGTGTGDIVVTTDRPYPLADSQASTALIAAYGRDASTMEALVQVLLGETTAPGLLPTPVGDYPIGAGCG